MRNERVFPKQYNFCNKTLASMRRNVILSMTDVVHLSRQYLLLVLFTYVCGRSNRLFALLFFYEPVLDSSGEKDCFEPLAYAVLCGTRTVACNSIWWGRNLR